MVGCNTHHQRIGTQKLIIKTNDAIISFLYLKYEQNECTLNVWSMLKLLWMKNVMSDFKNYQLFKFETEIKLYVWSMLKQYQLQIVTSGCEECLLLEFMSGMDKYKIKFVINCYNLKLVGVCKKFSMLGSKFFSSSIDSTDVINTHGHTNRLPIKLEYNKQGGIYKEKIADKSYTFITQKYSQNTRKIDSDKTTGPYSILKACVYHIASKDLLSQLERDAIEDKDAVQSLCYKSVKIIYVSSELCGVLSNIKQKQHGTDQNYPVQAVSNVAGRGLVMGWTQLEPP